MWAREVRIGSTGQVAKGMDAGFPAELLPYLHAFRALKLPALRFFHPGKTWLVVDFVNDPGHSAGSTAIFEEISPPLGMTARELDVLTLVALGKTNHQIAAALGTSSRTVSSQIESLLQKSDQDTRSGLAATAVEHGFLRLPFPSGSSGKGVKLVHTMLDDFVRGVPVVEHPQYTNQNSRMRVRPIRLGVMVPDGSAAADGQELIRGAELAVEEINQAWRGETRHEVQLVPRKADLFGEDSVYTSLNELFSDGVDAVITSYAVAEDPRAFDLAADYGQPFLHTSTFRGQMLRVEQDPRRYGSIFQTCPPETYYGQDFVNLVSRLETAGSWVPNDHTFTSIEVDSESTAITTDALVDYASVRGWSLGGHIRVRPGGTDWKKVLEEVAKTDPSVVVVTHFIASELVAFHRAFLETGLPALLIYAYGPSILKFQQELGADADGVVWSTTSGTYPDLIGQRFRQAYSRRFGQIPSWSQAGSAYDQVQLLAGAWRMSGTTETRDVSVNLRRAVHRGVNGVYYLGEAGQTSRAYPYDTGDPSVGQAHMTYQIQDGNHIPIGPSPWGAITDFRKPSWC